MSEDRSPEGEVEAGRPTVSVVVPFSGTQEQLDELAARLLSLATADGDELIVADNRPAGLARPPGPVPASGNGLRYCRASAMQSPGFARNAGARLASGDWLVFIDADTEPVPQLLQAYFEPAPEPSTALLAGAIEDIATRQTTTARYICSRAKMSQSNTLHRAGQGYVQTANCAVRRDAFERLGGFVEDVRLVEDADLCFRLARAGWGTEERNDARVAHRSRETLRALLGQLARHGAGAAWLNRRYPGEFPPPRPRQLLRRVPHYLRLAASALRRGDREAARFELIELASLYAFDLGRALSGRADRWPLRPRGS